MLESDVDPDLLLVPRIDRLRKSWRMSRLENRRSLGLLGATALTPVVLLLVLLLLLELVLKKLVPALVTP